MSNKVSVAALKDRVVVVVVADKDDAARKDAVGEEEEVNNPRVANDRVPRRKAIERDRLESMTDLMITLFWLVSQKDKGR